MDKVMAELYPLSPPEIRDLQAGELPGVFAPCHARRQIRVYDDLLPGDGGWRGRAGRRRRAVLGGVPRQGEGKDGRRSRASIRPLYQRAMQEHLNDTRVRALNLF